MKTLDEYLIRKPHEYDNRPQSKWGIAADGRSTIISDDREFAEQFDEWKSGACPHKRVGIVKYQNGGGAVCYNWFCAKCGQKLSSNIPHALAEGREEKASFSDMSDRSGNYEAERRASLMHLENAAADRCQPKLRDEYGEYLEGDYWAQISAKVMKRAHGICEGCLSQTAEQVHHVDYRNRGHEFAFQLVAICNECHDRYHAHTRRD